MLGRRSLLDEGAADRGAERGAPFRRLLGVERRMREEVGRLRSRLEESRDELNVHPQRVEQVVSVALALAGQPATRAARGRAIPDAASDRELGARDDRA